MKKKSNKSTLNFFKYLAIVLVIVSFLTGGLIYFINILPLKYFLILILIMIFINVILVNMLLSKSSLRRATGVLLSIIFIILMILGINYELGTIDFLKNIGYNSYKTENYNIIVLKDGNYNNINDLRNKTISHLDENNNEGLKKALTSFRNTIKFREESLDDINDLTDALLSKTTEAIILEDAQLEILSEENALVYGSLKIIYAKEIETKIANIASGVDITTQQFNIYITGMDTYGTITKVSRSDVNILMSINPKTNEILLTSIPRDYYVKLAKINQYDKLTHAGIHGVETSVKTIEDLLDITIDYYVKVNFTSLVDLVDTLNGITVDSKYAFKTVDGYYFKEGLNKLNGAEALSFSRERKAFKEGDRVRGENQERVLTAIIKKVLSPAIIIKYNELLNTLKNNMITNLDESQIKEFVKKQIDSPKDWNISQISLNGSNSYEYTYSYPKSKLYVMLPNEESVTTAKIQIKQVLN